MSRVRWRNQFTELDSQSKFHNKVRGIFATDPFFKSLKCYQEIAVAELCEDYPYRNQHFDWYIDELHMIIELHGAQHYKMVNRGNIGYDQAMKKFREGQQRDSDKKYAAEQAGYKYVAIHYREYNKLNAVRLKELLLRD